MDTTYSSTLKIHKLTKTQYDGITTKDETALYLTPEQPVTFTTSGGASAGATYDGSAAVTVSYATVGAAASSHTHYYAGSATVGGAANSVKTSLTFNSGGSGASSGTTYNGSTARTISYNTIGAASSGHTHTCSITNSSGTAVTSLSHGTTYTLTAGGSSTSFTLPSDNNTDTKVTQTQVSSSSYNYNYPILMAANSVSTTSSQTTTTYKNYNNLYANPYSGQLTATTFYATSDKRLKENIKPFEFKKSVLDLPVVEFDFKDSGKHQIGCIAQDLQEICPEIVDTNENGYLTINESKIVYLLIDEVKKLKAEVEELKARA